MRSTSTTRIWPPSSTARRRWLPPSSPSPSGAGGRGPRSWRRSSPASRSRRGSGASSARTLAERGWHVTAVLGHFGAVAAAGKLLGLTAEQLARAFGIAGTQAAGLEQSFGTMCKPLHPGKAAMNGLLAALLAREGFTGPTGVLDERPGLPGPSSASPIWPGPRRTSARASRSSPTAPSSTRPATCSTRRSTPAADPASARRPPRRRSPRWSATCTRSRSRLRRSRSPAAASRPSSARRLRGARADPGRGGGIRVHRQPRPLGTSSGWPAGSGRSPIRARHHRGADAGPAPRWSRARRDRAGRARHSGPPGFPARRGGQVPAARGRGPAPPRRSGGCSRLFGTWPRSPTSERSRLRKGDQP